VYVETHDQADSLAFIPDDELFATVQRLTARSNVALADLLAHLGEVERRGIHRTRACASKSSGALVFEASESWRGSLQRSTQSPRYRARRAHRSGAMGRCDTTPRPALPDIQLRALRSLVKELRARKHAATERPRKTLSPSRRDAESAQASGAAPEQATSSDDAAPERESSSRYIPSRMRRAVFDRDDARCAYLDSRGKRKGAHGPDAGRNGRRRFASLALRG
jgi:hypothetical protein